MATNNIHSCKITKLYIYYDIVKSGEQYMKINDFVSRDYNDQLIEYSEPIKK